MVSTIWNSRKKRFL